MGIMLTVVILVLAASLLIGAVIYGVLRNNRARGFATTSVKEDVPSPAGTRRP